MTFSSSFSFFAFVAACTFFFAAPRALSATTEPSSNTAPIDLPAPIGEDMKGIVIPQYDQEGHLTMNFLAEKARKIDESHVEIDSLRVDFFEKEGKDITVTIPHGIFDLETKILSTDSPVTIKREDFDITASSASFDTVKRTGTLKGHVHTEMRNEAPSEDL